MTWIIVIAIIAWVLMGKVQILQIIRAKSEIYDIPWRFTWAIAWNESGLAPDAVGDDGHSFGVMQILDTTAEWIEGRPVPGKELLKPEYNIELGVRYIKYQFDRYSGDLRKVASAYNAGTYTESNAAYVNRVMSTYDAIPSLPV